LTLKDGYVKSQPQATKMQKPTQDYSIGAAPQGNTPFNDANRSTTAEIIFWPIALYLLQCMLVGGKFSFPRKPFYV